MNWRWVFKKINIELSLFNSWGLAFAVGHWGGCVLFGFVLI